MSLATLKRKTNAQYRTLSSNTPQFSLNGTHRNQGYIGQSTQSRFIIRTLMKGNVIRGHGGTDGRYPVLPIVKDLSTFTVNDPTVIKSSVLGTKGMMDTKYRWIRRPQPYTSVKPDLGDTLYSQSTYIENIKRNSMQELVDCQDGTEAKPPICDNRSITDVYKYMKYNSNYKKPDIISDPTKVKKYAISHSEYLMGKLYNNCQAFNDEPMKKTTQNTPFGCKPTVSIK